MNNLFKFLGIVVLVAVVGFTMGCETEAKDDSNPFIGTWTGSASGVTYTMTFTETSFTLTEKEGNNTDVSTGTYTRKGKKATVSAGDGIKTITISGKSFTVDGITFTKT
jgi:hypothetical protein